MSARPFLDINILIYATRADGPRAARTTELLAGAPPREACLEDWNGWAGAGQPHLRRQIAADDEHDFGRPPSHAELSGGAHGLLRSKYAHGSSPLDLTEVEAALATVNFALKMPGLRLKIAPQILGARHFEWADWTKLGHAPDGKREEGLGVKEIDFDALAVDDLRRLVDNQVPESRMLEYKQDFWKADRDGTKEFLADIVAFANTQGGNLVVGIQETSGLPSVLGGVALADPDAKIQGLEAQLRDRVEPRINGIRIRWIEIGSGVGALILRIPSSLAGPHRDKVTGRFHARNNGGKYEIDVQELRDAFAGGEQLTARLRQLHMDTIEAPGTDKIGFALPKDPIAIASVIPVDVFRARRDLEITCENAVMSYWPRTASRNWDLVLEGIVWSTLVQDGLIGSYAVTHRTGRVDGLWTIGGERQVGGGNPVLMVFAPSFERGLLDTVNATQTRLKLHGVDGPWVVQASLISIAGTRLAKSQPTIRRIVHLPEVIGQSITEADLLPIVRAFWRVYGLERPPS